MKFYRIVEITEDEYYAMTSDTNYEECYQCTVPFNNALYIAIDENEERLELLHNEEIKEVVFQGFTNPPELLTFQDITNNANDWLNQVMAEYYGKESVRREE